MKIGEYLKDYRKRMGISQRKFSEQCGLSNAYISMLEKDENPRTGKPIELNLKKYKAIASATGITVHELFEILGPDAPVTIENPTISFNNLSQPLHPSVIEMINKRFANIEDEQLLELWGRATPAAKKAALAVLKSMEESDRNENT